MGTTKPTAEFLSWIEERRPAYYHFIAVHLSTHTFLVEMIDAQGQASEYLWADGKPEPFGSDRKAAMNGFKQAIAI